MKTYTLHLIKTFLLVVLSLPLQAQFLPCTFSANTNPVSPGVVDFTTTPGTTGNYIWDFGDNTTGSGAQVSHTYNGVGPFNVCLSQIDSTGQIFCRSCTLVYPFGPTNPQCSFTFVPDPHDSLGMIFAASSNLSAFANWDFGDGTSGSGLNPTHHFPAPGTYTVCVVLTDTLTGAPQTCTRCYPVVVGANQGITCSFNVSSAPVGPGILTFSAVVPPHSNVSWTFGDGTAGSGPQVTHTYLQTGTYPVCMTVSDTLGNTICTFCHPVTINGNPGNQCQFSFQPSAVNAMDIQFNSQVALGSNMTWDFGDGTTGVGANPTHTYVGPGIYNVCNTLTDAAGLVICHNCKLVNVHNIQPPVCHANFNAVSLGLTGYFIESSTANPATATYTWDFGDGNSSSTRFPQHQYSAPGIYTVCLDIADSGCVDRYCAPLVVDTTINNPVFCNSYFVTLQMAPFQLVVVNMSSGINLNFHWDFGDGTTSNQHYPTHSYATYGTYILCLTVTGGGCVSTYCDTVSVDSTGHVFRLGATGFTVNVVSPDQITDVTDISQTSFFSIYPNPVADVLNVQIDASGESDYRVLNINGAEVAVGKFNKDRNELKTSEWKAGFYMLEVTRNDGTRNYQKLVKE
ncbi:MAG: PKD domain-containing protein [Bacteroidia bacterium]|nr:PKD domain-containing protein [Bacteroidia bacterium]